MGGQAADEESLSPLGSRIDDSPTFGPNLSHRSGVEGKGGHGACKSWEPSGLLDKIG